MTKNRSRLIAFFLTSLVSFSTLAYCVDEDVRKEPFENTEALYSINFRDIPVMEFIRFVSKVTQEHFIFNAKDLEFHVTFSSGKPISSSHLVKSLEQLLRTHNFLVTKEDNSYVIYKNTKKKKEGDSEDTFASLAPVSTLVIAAEEKLPAKIEAKKNFHIYKLQYHEGSEIVESLKSMATEISATSSSPQDLLQAVQSLQWMKATNSLIYSGNDQVIAELQKIIESLDVPLRQVFIEILVIETDVKKSLDFGLQWAAGGQIGNKVGFGGGSFAPNSHNPSFSSAMQGINATNTPTGLGQLPIVPGFDLGVIGDIIMHKGRSYLSLGSLVSALQVDGDSTIVLNQKIITQDNKHSKIFVGDNIPFTGSVVQTVGQSQQTTANIEYRDVGVSLNITPMLGEGDVITLNLDEEITEAIDESFSNASSMNGIRTTKTNMLTHVHVPDKHFLVLSGMIRNAKHHQKAGIPCLGGLPFIGALFSKDKKHDEKRNIIIFVRPQIIHSFKDYEKITQNQEILHERQANANDFSQGLQTLPPIE